MSYLGNNSSFLSRLMIQVETTLLDRLEQIYRLSRAVLRPFRYWNVFSLLKFGEYCLYLNGMVFFLASNRLLRSSCYTTTSHHDGIRSILRQRLPNSSNELWATLFWTLFCGLGGYPFITVRHPSSSRSVSWFRRFVHPSMYWSFLSLYKILWSTHKVAAAAEWLTDPRRSPQWLRWMHRERIVQLNIRHRRQWADLQKTIYNVDNKHVKYVQIENKWVSFGSLGAAVHDVIDEAREVDRLTSHQVTLFFGRLGNSLRDLQEISIAMSLPLPLMAVGRLLETAHKLKHVRLDRVALSVQGDLRQDIIDFGRILHGVTTREALPLQTLSMENCWLVEDEMDPQERQRFSLDLLLSPAILTAMTPPTSLKLQHLTLLAKCQMISALELAVMLRANTTLKSLTLGLRHDNDDGEQEDEEEEDDWFVVPLCQVLQYFNRTLETLNLRLSRGVTKHGFSHTALIHMIKHNDTLRGLHMIRSDQQLRVRIPEVEFYLYLNRLGRRQIRLDWDRMPRCQWVELLISERHNTAVVYYFLSLYPALVLNYHLEEPGRRRRQGREL